MSDLPEKLISRKRIIDHIIDVEGGYINDPDDSGGETNFGITVAVARANGYPGRMDCMPRQVACDIYTSKYWDAVRADDLPPLVCEEVVDTAVNMGVGRASIFLQRAINVLSSDAALVVDGDIGTVTIKALNAYLKRRDAATLVKALNCLQGSFYIHLAETRVKDKRFVYGWLKNRVTI